MTDTYESRYYKKTTVEGSLVGNAQGILEWLKHEIS